MNDSNSTTPVSGPAVTESTTPEAGPQAPSGKKKRNRLQIAIIVILVLIVLILLYMLFRPKPEANDGRATFVSPDNLDEVEQILSTPVTDAYYTTKMTVDWYFDNGEAVSTNSYVENSTENTRTVYFDVTLSDGTLIYSSPYLPVGERIEQFTLDQDLDAGDYPAVCTYYLVDDDHQVITDVSVAITIHILN